MYLTNVAHRTFFGVFSGVLQLLVYWFSLAYQTFMIINILTNSCSPDEPIILIGLSSSEESEESLPIAEFAVPIIVVSSAPISRRMLKSTFLILSKIPELNSFHQSQFLQN